MAEGKFTYSISTMGCKANLTDSQELEARLRKLGGLETKAEEADLYLLNTCTVTDQADKEARQLLRKGKAPFMIATGCLAEVDPEQLALGSNDTSSRQLKVLRNSAKDQLETVVQEWLAGVVQEQKTLHGDRVGWHEKILANRDPAMAVQASYRTRAFYKVQDGCNAFCSYCVIPLARGRSRSLPAEQVVQEIQAIVDSGVKEVALTAIHAADYEWEGLNFTALVEKILRETSVPRLRLTSLDPAEIPDALLALMQAQSRLCPHFHVSLQAANGRVLAAMKRGYGTKEIEDRLWAIHRALPHAYVGMDLIAGFPGETDEEFMDGFLRLEKLPFTKAHVFPFSMRRNTAAARLVSAGLAVPAAKIQWRATQLRTLSEQKFRAALQAKVGSVLEVLVEEKQITVGTRICSTGHGRNFYKVLIPGQHQSNQFKRVRIVGVHQDYLKGELV